MASLQVQPQSRCATSTAPDLCLTQSASSYFAAISRSTARQCCSWLYLKQRECFNKMKATYQEIENSCYETLHSIRHREPEVQLVTDAEIWFGLKWANVPSLVRRGEGGCYIHAIKLFFVLTAKNNE